MPIPLALQLSHTLSAPPAAVYACLTDMDQFVATHPLIYRVAQLGGQRYRMFERMPGMRWLRFSYPAEIVGDPQRRVVQMQAKVFGLMTIAMVFSVKPAGRGCIVEEAVDIRTRLPVQKLATKVFRAQHLQWFQNIDVHTGAKDVGADSGHVK